MFDNLVVHRLVNQLMSSNCYIIHNNISRSCIIIDPGSEKSENEIKYIEENYLSPEYIILTHEHTDHNWGVNALRERFHNIKLVCTDACEKNISKTNRSYFLFYYNISDYEYVINTADIVISKPVYNIYWDTKEVRFILTPGHTPGSMCIIIDNNMFSGDTIMLYKSYIPKNIGSKKEFEDTINKLLNIFKDKPNLNIYPGHGNRFFFDEFKILFSNK